MYHADQGRDEELHVVENLQHQEPAPVVPPDHPDIGGVLPKGADDLIGGSALFIILHKANIMRLVPNITEEGLRLGHAYISFAVVFYSTDGPSVVVPESRGAINTIHPQEIIVKTLSQRSHHP